MASPKLQAHLERLHQSNRKPEAARNRVLHAYTFGAKRRKLVFDLQVEKFEELILQNCHYCNAQPSNTMNDGGYGFKYNGIDRLNSAEGYTESNCVACCDTCNYMKGTLSKEEFLARISMILKKFNGVLGND